MLRFFYHSRNRKTSMIERAVEYILSTKLEKMQSLTAADVAAKLKRNPMFLSFMFLIVRKISIANFIHREKLHRAFFILEKDRDISILELAEKLGFKEPEIFEEEFEKYFAVKPILFQEYRGRSRNFDKTLYKPTENIFEKLRDIV